MLFIFNILVHIQRTWDPDEIRIIPQLKDYLIQLKKKLHPQTL